MDRDIIDGIILQVKNDVNRVNNYDGIETLINLFSDEDLFYLFDGCGEDLFMNITLTYKFIDNKPIQLKSYITGFVSEYINIAHKNIKSAKLSMEEGIMQKVEGNSYIELCEDSIVKLMSFQSGYIVEIDKQINLNKLK